MVPPPDASTTLVVVLGASEFKKAPKLQSSLAFKRSAKALKNYFLNVDGFGLPPENLLDCFDSRKGPSDLDEQLGKFLETRSKELDRGQQKARDVLVYYIGHGGFSSDGSEYFLALRTTRQNHPLISSYQIKSLAKTMKESARHLRKYLILDSCFSAAAYEAFQSPPLEVATQKTLEQFPQKGTALLAAAGPRDPAKTLPKQTHTMFTGALLDVLREGAADEPEKLSLATIGDLVWSRIKDLYEDEAVRPEVHSPDQKQGDVAILPIFPNKNVLTSKRKLVKPLASKGKRLTGIVDILYQSHKLLRDAEKAGGNIWFAGLTFAFGPAHDILDVRTKWNNKYKDVIFEVMSDEFNAYLGSLLGGTLKFTKSEIYLVALRKELLKKEFLKPLYKKNSYRAYLKRFPYHLTSVEREISVFHDRIEAFANIIEKPIAYVEEMHQQVIVTEKVSKGKRKAACTIMLVGTGNIGHDEPQGFYSEIPSECDKMKKYVMDLYNSALE